MPRYLYIVWNERFDTGVPILDEQHHGMVATINSLFYFIQEGWGLASLKPTLDLMQRYATFHAKTEEGVLSKINFDGLGQHQELHRQFMANTANRLADTINQQDPDVLLKYLRQWWLAHLEVHHSTYDPALQHL